MTETLKPKGTWASRKVLIYFLATKTLTGLKQAPKLALLSFAERGNPV